MATLPELGSRKTPIIQVNAYGICHREFPHAGRLAHLSPDVNKYQEYQVNYVGISRLNPHRILRPVHLLFRLQE
jgi:hypothetical protein